jgi:hypothetical protein
LVHYESQVGFLSDVLGKVLEGLRKQAEPAQSIITIGEKGMFHFKRMQQDGLAIQGNAVFGKKTSDHSEQLPVPAPPAPPAQAPAVPLTASLQPASVAASAPSASSSASRQPSAVIDKPPTKGKQQVQASQALQALQGHIPTGTNKRPLPRSGLGSGFTSSKVAKQPASR